MGFIQIIELKTDDLDGFQGCGRRSERPPFSTVASIAVKEHMYSRPN